jgi:hypothetical protein
MVNANNQLTISLPVAETPTTQFVTLPPEILTAYLTETQVLYTTQTIPVLETATNIEYATTTEVQYVTMTEAASLETGTPCVPTTVTIVEEPKVSIVCLTVVADNP